VSHLNFQVKRIASHILCRNLPSGAERGNPSNNQPPSRGSSNAPRGGGGRWTTTPDNNADTAAWNYQTVQPPPSAQTQAPPQAFRPNPRYYNGTVTARFGPRFLDANPYLTCLTCGESFPDRSDLFEHLDARRHAVDPVTKQPEAYTRPDISRNLDF
jgi:hypothetical protein